MSNDQKHLEWIYDRLIHVYSESPNVDYMLRFRGIIDGSGAAQPPTSQPAPMQRLIDAPMDARGYADLREPAPPAAPAGGLVERVLRELPAGTDLSCARAVIRVVQLWAGQLGLQRTERKLREEADR
jgi:hypothetical protein